MLPFRFSMLIRRSNGLLSDWVEDALRGSLISSHTVRVLDLVRLLVFELWLDGLWFWEPNLLRTRGSDR
ncbi:GM17758 [Drosophila sechellia]|uniref:GM17758 n=1 Tax=Drosophila sechellia TaxID=7238 RepID=B4IJE7_DROSE|nr:GM17758 [Drosophila sechellia]